MINVLHMDVPLVDFEGKKTPSHQGETWQKLQNTDAVFNCFPTGTGKTRALLHAIRKNGIERALIIAPINQLIEQYAVDVQEYLGRHNMPHRVEIITGPGLDKKGPNHSKELRNILQSEGTGQPVIAIANPDILHYVIVHRYGKHFGASDLFSRLIMFPELVAFDEFHIYDPQRLFFAISMLLNAKEAKRNTKFLFLSATPHPTFLEVVKQMGFSPVVLEPGEKPGEESTT
ncbi:MAG TPA: type I-D CRISPR-associated helicase Cas3', partial [Thermotogota bacterium]|nr:type I-D CRISPR-associated helicase Cas3' [Thermotogota bacterium]